MEVQEATIFQQSGCGSKVWGNFTHVRPITYSMCRAQVDGIVYCLAIVWENGGVQGPGTIFP